MKKYMFLIFVLLLLNIGFPISSSADDAYEVMLNNYNVYGGDDSKSVMTMVLVNKNNKKRIREVIFWTLEKRDEDKSLMYFLSPAADKGTAFLTWEHKEKDDDQWLYLPVLKKVKRISAGDKHKSFMGTDFSYNDLAPPHPDEFVHKLIKDETIDGSNCYVIESIHKTYTDDSAYTKKKKYQYARQLSWIRKDNYLLVKAEMFDKKGRSFKVFLASDIKQIDGVWTAMHLGMKNVKTGHKTILTMKDIRYNIGLNDGFFTTRELEKAR